MEAFITGSRKYGTPTEDSDVDLVIRCSSQTAALLSELADDVVTDADYGMKPENVSLRFGKLNLLCCLNDATYAEWCLGTDTMCRNVSGPLDPPVRDQAIAVFEAIRARRFQTKG